MKKVLTVYVTPLEMDSTEYHLVDLPAAQDRLDTLLLEMNKGFPLYTEVSDYIRTDPQLALIVLLIEAILA